MKWQNEDNNEYYENIPVDVLRGYAINGGFEDGCDIDLIYAYIASTNSVIEPSAAYGRVIKRLIQKGYKGKICAIERSNKFYRHLQKLYKNRAEIIHADIQKYQPLEKVDAILWMWSSISEFPKDQQLPILTHLSSWLKPQGIFIIETILHTLIPNNVSTVQDQTYVVYSNYGTAHGYTPSTEEVHEYAITLGFQYIKHINYKTTTERARILHIFSNSPI